MKKLTTELPPEQFEEAINNFIEREASGSDELEATTFFALLDKIEVSVQGIEQKPSF